MARDGSGWLGMLGMLGMSSIRPKILRTGKVGEVRWRWRTKWRTVATLSVFHLHAEERVPLDRAECRLLRSGSNIGKGAYGDELRRCEDAQHAVNSLGTLGMARDGSGWLGMARDARDTPGAPGCSRCSGWYRDTSGCDEIDRGCLRLREIDFKCTTVHCKVVW